MDCNFPNLEVAKIAMKYQCTICDYYTSRKSSYEKHIITVKHMRLIGPNFPNLEVAKVAKKDCICVCGKKYAHMSSLCNHKRNCKKHVVVNNVKSIVDTLNNDDELKNFLIEQNKQLMDQLSQQNIKIIEQNDKLISITENKTNYN